MNLKEAYTYSSEFLKRNQVDESEFKAKCIVCSLCDIKNSEFDTNLDQYVSEAKLAKMLVKLRFNEPLQYVIGKWDFYESEFYVGPGVLIPRPETEELVDLCLNEIDGLSNPVVIDLCSGSGCIGLSIAKKIPDSVVYCVEKSVDAFEYLKKNSQGIENVVLINDDILKELDLPIADIIVSNPPYIESDVIDTLQEEVKKEPSMALDGGKDGLDFYRIINEKYSGLIKRKLLLEIGENQGKSIIDVLSNFDNIIVLKDLYNNDRFVVANPKE